MIKTKQVNEIWVRFWHPKLLWFLETALEPPLLVPLSRRVLSCWVAPHITPSFVFAHILGCGISGFSRTDRYTRVNGTDGSHLTLCPGSLPQWWHGGTGKVGEPLRDLGTCLEEGSTGNPLANGQYSLLVAKLAVDKTVGSSLTVWVGLSWIDWWSSWRFFFLQDLKGSAWRRRGRSGWGVHATSWRMEKQRSRGDRLELVGANRGWWTTLSEWSEAGENWCRLRQRRWRDCCKWECSSRMRTTRSTRYSLTCQGLALQVLAAEEPAGRLVQPSVKLFEHKAGLQWFKAPMASWDFVRLMWKTPTWWWNKMKRSFWRQAMARTTSWVDAYQVRELEAKAGTTCWHWC